MYGSTAAYSSMALELNASVGRRRLCTSTQWTDIGWNRLDVVEKHQLGHHTKTTKNDHKLSVQTRCRTRSSTNHLIWIMNVDTHWLRRTSSWSIVIYHLSQHHPDKQIVGVNLSSLESREGTSILHPVASQVVSNTNIVDMVRQEKRWWRKYHSVVRFLAECIRYYWRLDISGT